MNILYCGDANMRNGLIISILSLLRNVKEKLNIYVFTMEYKTSKKEFKGISDRSIDCLDKIVKKINKESFVRKIDITDLFMKEPPKRNLRTFFTPYCMLRLFADEVPNMPDKILYLDTDVICRKDITDFYNQNIKEYEFAGVLDHYGRWFFRNNFFKFDYINSGVLLLNLTKIKETGLFKKSRERCRKKNMLMPDQSALNKIAISKKIWPRKYNEQRKLHDDTVIQHFTTSFRLFPVFHTFTVKPWEIEKVHRKMHIFEYDDLFDEYLKIKIEIEA